MNFTKLITELEEVSGQIGVRIRYEKGDFDGGYCILREEKILVVNKRLTDARKASILAQALTEIGIDSIFIKPALRDFIDNEAAKYRKSTNLIKKVASL